MTTTTLPDETVQALHERVHGDVLQPGDDGYEAARTVFNAMIDKYPSYVVRPAGSGRPNGDRDPRPGGSSGRGRPRSNGSRLIGANPQDVATRDGYCGGHHLALVDSLFR